MTIITLKVSLLSGAYANGPWEAEIEIESSAPLEDLHFGIQDALEFDDDHLYEFFISRTETSRNRVRFDDEDASLYETTIGSLYPLPERRNLYYLFDYGDDWLFRVANVNKSESVADSRATYPRVVRESGTKPTQYPEINEDA